MMLRDGRASGRRVVVTYYTQQQAAIIGKTTVPFMSERKSDAIAPAGIGENPHSRLIEVE